MVNELFITLAVCVDTYLTAVNYSSSGIRIPQISAMFMSLISATILYISLFFSEILQYFIPVQICSAFGFIILTAIGTVTILKTVIRRMVKRLSERGDVCLKMSSFGLCVRLYLDETTADLDYSKDLSIKESVALALALSVDSFAVGINAGFLGANALRTSLLTLIIGFIVILLGSLTGKKLHSQKYDLSWLGGMLLIVIAVVGII